MTSAKIVSVSFSGAEGGLSRVGEDQARVGEDQARVGEDQARVGEDQARVGEDQAKVGEEVRTGEGEDRVERKFKLKTELPRKYCPCCSYGSV